SRSCTTSCFWMDPASPASYTLSLHDALPIFSSLVAASAPCGHGKPRPVPSRRGLRHSRLDLWQITTTNAHSHSSPGTATQYRQEELLRGAASTQRSSDRHTPAATGADGCHARPPWRQRRTARPHSLDR